MGSKKTSHADGKRLVEAGILTQEGFDEAIRSGHIASERVAGGRSRFVSEDQEAFYRAKVDMTKAVKKVVDASAAVKKFMEEYSDWEIDGNAVKLSITVGLKNFQKCIASFTAETGEVEE